MIPNTIEKEVVIKAPPEVVWRVVTDPDQIRQWFADEDEVELRVGGSGRLRFKSGDSYYDHTRPARYPNGRTPTDDVFSFRFAFMTNGQIKPQPVKVAGERLILAQRWAQGRARVALPSPALGNIKELSFNGLLIVMLIAVAAPTRPIGHFNPAKSTGSCRGHCLTGRVMRYLAKSQAIRVHQPAMRSRR